MSFGVNLKIRQESPQPGNYRVWLDGHEISHGTTGLDITLDAMEPTRATLRIFVNDLDLDAGTLAVLEAHVAARNRDIATQRIDRGPA